MSTTSSLRKTKIVATLGPACDRPEILRNMIRCGMNVVRLNLSHGSYTEHAERVESYCAKLPPRNESM